MLSRAKNDKKISRTADWPLHQKSYDVNIKKKTNLVHLPFTIHMIYGFLLPWTLGRKNATLDKTGDLCKDCVKGASDGDGWRWRCFASPWKIFCWRCCTILSSEPQQSKQESLADAKLSSRQRCVGLLFPRYWRRKLENKLFSNSRSTKVIDLGANRKRICNFLLVISSNFGRISYRFEDIKT